MAIEKAMWAHGHSMIIEHTSRINKEWRAGFYIQVVGKPNTTNWFHFAIPTPVIVDNNRLAIDSAMIRFRCKSNNASITNVHVFDGEVKILDRNGLDLSPLNWDTPRFDVPGHPNVKWGIGVTIGVAFNGGTDAANTIEISSAGVDFLP